MTKCLQLRADKHIRKLAARNDMDVVEVTTDDLIAKEACYHLTCYRDYTRPLKQVPNKNNDANDGTADIIRFLVSLYEKPDIVEYKKLQDMVTTSSGKKNLKGSIENKTKLKRI